MNAMMIWRRVRFKVTVDAPAYFRNEVWFGMEEK